MLRKAPVPSPSTAAPRRSADVLDHSLMERVVARDLRAFETLYRIYHVNGDKLADFAIALTGILSPVAADFVL